MIKADKYQITVQHRDTDDGELFEGTVKELPDVAVYAETFADAYDLACDAIEGLYELAIEQGRSFPQPAIRETEYSGKFVVRVPKWLHRNLAEAAVDQGTSLNQFVVSVLGASTVITAAESNWYHFERFGAPRATFTVGSGTIGSLVNFGSVLAAPDSDYGDISQKTVVQLAGANGVIGYRATRKS